MAFELTEGFIDLTVHHQNFNSAMASVSQRLNRVHSQMQRVSRTARRMFLAAGVAGGVAIKTYGNFERAMRQATAVSEVSEIQFRKMSGMAEKQSIRLNMALTDAAKAFYFLGSTELSVSEQMQAFIPVTGLAKAGLMGVGETAEYVVDILTGFQIPAKNSARVTDVLTTAANNANQTIGQFAESLKEVSGLARQTNNSLEATTTAIAMLASVGFKGRRAGVIMRRALLNLAAPMSKARKLMDDYNISVYNSEGKMKPFIQIVGEIGEALKDATEEQQNMAFQTLFGQRAIVGQLRIFEVGVKRLQEFNDMLVKTGGSTEKVVQKQLAALLEQFGRWGKAIKVLTVAIGGPLGESLRGLNEKLIEVTESMTAWVRQHETATKVIGLTTIAVLGLTAALTTAASISFGLAAYRAMQAAAAVAATKAIVTSQAFATLSVASQVHLTKQIGLWATLKTGAVSAMKAIIAAAATPIGLTAIVGLGTSYVLMKKIGEHQKIILQQMEKNVAGLENINLLEKEYLALKKEAEAAEAGTVEKRNAEIAALKKQIELESKRLRSRKLLLETAEQPRWEYGFLGEQKYAGRDLTAKAILGLEDMVKESQNLLASFDEQLATVIKINNLEKLRIENAARLLRFSKVTGEAAKKSRELQSRLDIEALSEYNQFAASRLQVEVDFEKEREELIKQYAEAEKKINDYRIENMKKADLAALETWRAHKLKTIEEAVAAEIDAFLRSDEQQQIAEIERNRDRLIQAADIENKIAQIKEQYHLRSEEKRLAEIEVLENQRIAIIKKSEEKIAEIKAERLEAEAKARQALEQEFIQYTRGAEAAKRAAILYEYEARLKEFENDAAMLQKALVIMKGKLAEIESTTRGVGFMDIREAWRTMATKLTAGEQPYQRDILTVLRKTYRDDLTWQRRNELEGKQQTELLRRIAVQQNVGGLPP